MGIEVKLSNQEQCSQITMPQADPATNQGDTAIQPGVSDWIVTCMEHQHKQQSIKADDRANSPFAMADQLLEIAQ